MASELEDLERDLPTTPEDVRALRRARQDSRMTATEIVRTLAQLPPVDPAWLRDRPGPRGEPFRLPPCDEDAGRTV